MLEALLDEVIDQRGLAISTERAGRQEAAWTWELEELSGELVWWAESAWQHLGIPLRAVIT